jgi:hypothetical protein
MKRFAALLLCIALIVTLSACGMKNDALQYVKECWKEIDCDEGDGYAAYIMKYTSREYLNDDVLETPMYDDIPKRGYAIVMKVYPSSNLFVGFFTDNGELVLLFDHKDNEKLSEECWRRFTRFDDFQAAEKHFEISHNCNYIYRIWLDAMTCEENVPRGALEENIWYCLSEKQLKKAVN